MIVLDEESPKKDKHSQIDRPLVQAPILMFILLNEIFHQDYSRTLYIQNPNKAINHQRLQWASGNQNLMSRQESLYSVDGYKFNRVMLSI